jgi:hypothetical protein
MLGMKNLAEKTAAMLATRGGGFRRAKCPSLKPGINLTELCALILDTRNSYKYIFQYINNKCDKQPSKTAFYHFCQTVRRQAAAIVENSE